MYLGGNGLAGRLHDGASGLEQLTMLAKLSLFGNDLTGPVSVALATLPPLNYLDLEANDRLAHVPPLDAGTQTGAQEVKLECKTVGGHNRHSPYLLATEDLLCREGGDKEAL